MSAHTESVGPTVGRFKEPLAAVVRPPVPAIGPCPVAIRCRKPCPLTAACEAVAGRDE